MSEALNDTDVKVRPVKAVRAKQTLSWVALFLGELRDGLTMVSYSSHSFISVGVLYLLFALLLLTNVGSFVEYDSSMTSIINDYPLQ